MMAMNAPVLLCLNLRREHVCNAHGVRTALAEVAGVLSTFRTNGWRVLHAYTVQPRRGGSEFGALDGFEPVPREPVFALLGASALAEPQIAAALRDTGGGATLAGGVYSRCGLATLLAAHEQRIRFSVIREACFAPLVEAAPEHQILDLANADAPGAARAFGAEAWGANIICLDTRRP